MEVGAEASASKLSHPGIESCTPVEAITYLYASRE